MKNKYFINFLNREEIKKIIDPTAEKVIEYLLKKLAFSQPELMDENETTGIQVTKEFLESWIAQSCDFLKTGSGNYPIDVYKEKSFGIDVKSVSAKVDEDGKLKTGDSGESSLGQNFQDDDINLDTLFNNREKDRILNKWKIILNEKIKKASNELKLKGFYYFTFIRGGSKMYLSIAEIKKENIEKLKATEITKTSLFVENVLDNKYGNVKIYKSKKRMELRLYPKKLYDDNLLIEWDLKKLKPSVANLRSVLKNREINKHLKNEIKKFFSL